MSDLIKDPMILRSIIMDHYEYPRDHELTKKGGYVQKHIASESCIDDIHIQSRIRDGVVEDMCSDGVACTISTVPTSIMSELPEEEHVEEAEDIIANYFHMTDQRGYDEEKPKEAVALHNVGGWTNQIKCATIGWKATGEIIEEGEECHEWNQNSGK